MTPEHWGVIHNDLQGSNILTWQGDIRPIDFSLCGWGYYLADLGTTLPSLKSVVRSSFLAGYQAYRPLASDAWRLIDGFFLLSRLGAYVYMLSDPAHQGWLQNRIPRFVAHECCQFIRTQPLLFTDQ